MKILVLDYVVENVRSTTEKVMLCNQSDKHLWIHTSSENVIVTSAWNILRQRKEK